MWQYSDMVADNFWHYRVLFGGEVRGICEGLDMLSRKIYTVLDCQPGEKTCQSNASLCDNKIQGTTFVDVSAPLGTY